ncbi:MAG: sulfite exporter TauE/SafE family protein [Syntrophobacteraceae bacterium]
MIEIIAPFTLGLVGSLHCLGMCGPLIIAWSLHYRSASTAGGHRDEKGDWRALATTFLHHLFFHTGRIFTYGVLGTTVAALFESLEVQRFSTQYRGGVVTVSGILLLAMGLVILRVLPLPSSVAQFISSPGAGFGRGLACLAGSANPFAKIALGLAAGLIPCGLTWAMLVVAASTLSPFKGMLMMVSFGAGTMPLLLVAGMSATFLCVKTRLLGERAAAISVMAMGVLLFVQGVGILYGLWGSCCGGTIF